MYTIDAVEVTPGDTVTFTDAETQTIVLTHSGADVSYQITMEPAAGFELVSPATGTSVTLSDGETQSIVLRSLDDVPGDFSATLKISYGSTIDPFYLEVDISGYADRYCMRSDLETLFGKRNILVWADVDGDRDENDVEQRIWNIITFSQEEVDNFLSNGLYDVPFTAPIPTAITEITAVLSAVRLFRNRAIENKDWAMMTTQRQKWAYGRLKDIETGRANIAKDRNAKNSPFVSEASLHR